MKRSVTMMTIACAVLAATCAGTPVGASTPVAVLNGRADGLVPAVEGTVRGRSVWFDLDTGALRSFLDLSAARALHEPQHGTVSVRGAGKGTTLPEGGILGFDFFKRYVVAVDFASYRVALYEPRSYRYDGGGVAVPLVIRAPRAYVSVEVAADGVAPERHLLRVELGSSDAVDDDIVLRSAALRRPATGGVGIGTRFASSLGTVSELRLGPFTLVELPAATGGVQLIGDQVWRQFNVVFDFSRSVMYLSPRRR